MVYRNKSLCLDCKKYLPCWTINGYCCGCIKSNRLIQEQPCLHCQNQPLGQETKIDQTKLTNLNYEIYKSKLRQEHDYTSRSGKLQKINPQASCSKCLNPVELAGHHGEVKNRYKTSFWEIETPYKVLCLDCLKGQENKMTPSKRRTFHKYLKRYIKPFPTP